jgi:hypothetical protein
VLGDVHIDRPEHHDMGWLATEHPADVRQVANYCRLTREVLPGLFEVVRKQIEAAPSEVPFVLQLGDLLEGLCGSPALAEKQARDALALVRDAKWSRPLLFAKGNHDVTGPGAAEVYRNILAPWQAPA